MAPVFRSVVCGVSGGVDSAVAAYLLSQRGFDVTGVFMNNWDKHEEDMCNQDGDRYDAAMVCKKLGIPFKEVNFVKEYWLNVFEYFLASYKRGLTPNPDVFCNRYIKFDAFYDYALRLGADAIATGHYARSSFGHYLELFDENAAAKLLCCADLRKDQTFFLCRIPQRSLRRTMFPLADLTKPEVKRIAARLGLAKLVSKQESEGICFIGRRNISEFMDKFIEPVEGTCIDVETGKQLPLRHSGIHKFTLGQRIGCWYVAGKNAERQELVLCNSNLHGALYASTFYVSSLYWFSGCAPTALQCGESCAVKMRWQRGKPQETCTLKLTPCGTAVQVSTVVPQRAVTPGQFAVFYDPEGVECLGSGEICAVGPSFYELGLAVPESALAVSLRRTFDLCADSKTCISGAQI